MKITPWGHSVQVHADGSVPLTFEGDTDTVEIVWADHTETDAWHEGYSAGHTAALNSRPRRDLWAPTTRRWRHVQPGDVFVSKGSALWHVDTATPVRGAIHVEARRGDRLHPVDVDPDATIDVLTPIPEHEALEVLAHQLGAAITAQTGPSG